MKKVVLLLAAALIAPFTVNAQEAGSSLPISFNIGASGQACGRVTIPTYCYGIPVVVQAANGPVFGTVWYDVYPNGTGFALFNGGLSFLGTAKVVSGSGYGPVTFSGKQSTADYTLTITLVPSFYRGGYGRNAGIYWLVTDQSEISLTYK